MRRVRARHWLAVAAAVVVVALAAVLAFFVFFADSARPVPTGSALARFRAADSHPRGIDGVYTYRTVGGESIDALGGAHHRYPARTTISVVEVSCGLQLRWDVLAGRRTTWTLCRESGRVSLQRLDHVHAFFGHGDHTVYVCSPPAAGGAFGCRSARGTVAGTETVVGPAAVEVGGVSVPAVHARISGSVGGDSHGTETFDWWLARATGLPLRLVLASRTSRKEPLVGDTHYREDATLQLVSTTPQR